MTIAVKTILALVLLIVPASARDLTVPDPVLTPGVARTDLTLHQICTTKWGKDARAVTAKMKREVFTSYGISCRPLHGKSNRLPRCGLFEIDHLLSRELGGADDVKNLWPEKYDGPWNARMKDRVENRTHKELCEGRITLEQAQHDIISDWTKLYIKYFGEPK